MPRRAPSPARPREAPAHDEPSYLAGVEGARSRRSVHVVPGSSERFLAKAAQLDADQLVLDLEDAVSPDDKDRARGLVVDAVRGLDVGGKTLSVRVNATDSPHCHRDLIALAEGAGAQLATVMLPKVRTTADIAFADLLLSQLEQGCGLELARHRHRRPDRGRDRPRALRGDRRRTAGGGPALRPRRLQRGGRDPDDHDRRIARGLPRRPPQPRLLADPHRGARGGRPGDRRPVRRPRRRRGPADQGAPRAGARLRRQVVDPPRADRRRSTTIFTPIDAEIARADALLAAYESATTGAARFEGEMVDEASRKMAERVVRAGRAAGRVPPSD